MADRRVAVFGLVAVGLLATGCGRAPASETGGIRVGAVYPQSGNQAEGTEELNGVRLAARLVNQDGGVAGQKVEVVSEDAPSADQAAAAVDRLLATGIRMVVGTYGSTQALPASARASERGATYLETGAVADAVTSRGLPGILRTVATGSTLGRNAARWAHDFVIPGLGLKPGAERTVIMFEDDQYGSAVGYGAIDEAAAQGLHVVD
ncbi:MAG: ABC transporter substrate-binding protein, partial [Actinomycetota bacterium]|nr:ABC transporter substrate-binding protein [Actinomycetota bacterium]